jgi:hypothetical protein
MIMRNPTIALTLMAAILILPACGKTKRSGAAVNNVGAGSSNSTWTNTSTSTSTGTNTCTGNSCSPQPTDPPLSFEFSLNGNQVATTPSITTDNVLRVRFRVTAEQGNNVWKASELKVTIAAGGTEVTPTFTNSNFSYGQVGETSNIMDLSSYITPGQPVQIVVKNPANDFYCTYANWYWDGFQWLNTNPQYNLYPGCRKAVQSMHKWSGVLTIQTSSTRAL